MRQIERDANKSQVQSEANRERLNVAKCRGATLTHTLSDCRDTLQSMANTGSVLSPSSASRCCLLPSRAGPMSKKSSSATHKRLAATMSASIFLRPSIRLDCGQYSCLQSPHPWPCTLCSSFTCLTNARKKNDGKSSKSRPQNRAPTR